MTTVPTVPAVATVNAAPLAAQTWRSARLWLVLGLVAIASALAIASLGSATAIALDPSSSSGSGSKALAALLADRGTAVARSTSPSTAAASSPAGTVLITSPQSLGDDQLRQLAAVHRLVLIDPSPPALKAVTSAFEADQTADSGAIEPGCPWVGAQASGPVEFPDGTTDYTGDPGSAICFGGALVYTDRLVILGSADLLRNDQLTENNRAALDLNAISADGAVTSVTWLLPGAADTGTGGPSVWQLFPGWAQPAFWWLLVLGLLLALWRGRRLGPVVTEPLPVLVRAAEVVEGHGRLYRRAQARDRAAAILRAAAARRLAIRLGLDRRSSPAEVAAVATAQNDRGAPISSLTGAAPIDDDELLKLARNLAEIANTEEDRK